MGKIHALILMTGVAYGLFKMPNNEDLKGKDWAVALCKRV
jgi:hypothetical protein